MATLQDSVQSIPGIGTTQAKKLEKLGLHTLGDLVGYFPRSYEDRTATCPIRELIAGEAVCIRAMVAAPPTLSWARSGVDLVRLRVVDATAELDITYFNQSYLKNKFKQGETYVFYGKPEGAAHHWQMVNPLAELDGQQELTGCIVPLYPLTAGLSHAALARMVRHGLSVCGDLLPDDLPDEIRQAHGLCSADFAYENIHFPISEEALAAAKRRLVFEELFLLTCGLALLRERREDIAVPPCRAVDLTPFYGALPFSLTAAQKRSVEEAIGDMESGRPMNRLCQGDVGSGKTMVAAACIYFMAQNGRQSALMAPTEILAEQHFAGLSPLLAQLGIRCALLTGSIKGKPRAALLSQLAAGEVQLIIGTHALFTEDVVYADLGLVVTDEQHRFGVSQRTALSAKGDSPHLLVMSATPIPRTLALMIYGDLDVSILDELPPGREKIDTFAVGSSYHPRVYAFLRKQIAAGRQAFIVCSVVSESGEETDERKAVLGYAAHLQDEIFPDLRIAFVHGKMKAKEKTAVMRAFAAGETDILVSTTVIEVGMDVPNASVMVVENAERFGLSQLHQLRGRVGRGRHKSYCILISDPKTDETRTRLTAMVKTGDGFRIAEEDLRLRGPGDFFGNRQHGLPALKLADLSCDMPLLEEAKAAAAQLLTRDPTLLHHPAVRAQIAALFQRSADSLN
ncbi:MAG: ATP-dependent DNA helicase RecG [Oscillospiraceae bacterium]